MLLLLELQVMQELRLFLDPAEMLREAVHFGVGHGLAPDGGGWRGLHVLVVVGGLVRRDGVLVG